MLDADAPRLAALGSERNDVAADVDQRIGDAARLEQLGGTVERHALEITAEVESHCPVLSSDPVPVESQVGNRGARGDQGLQLLRIGQHRLEIVALKAPQRNQPADAGIEQMFALRRDRLRSADQAGQLRRNQVRPALRDGVVQGGQLGRLPGVIAAVQAVELAQHFRRRRASLRLGRPDNQHLDARAEDEGFLPDQRRFPGAASQQGQQQQGWQQQKTQEAAHSRSSASRNSPATSQPLCSAISTKQVGW